jgi:aminobenzoyl-glutamate utilization protein B
MARAAFRGLGLAGPPDVPAEMVPFAKSILRQLGRDVLEDPFDRQLTPPDAGKSAEFHGGADDVTEFCWHAPTARIYVAYGISMAGGRLPNWAPGAFARTAAAHATVRTASRAVAHTALDVLTDEVLREEAAAELARRLNDVGYVAPLIPAGVKPPIGLDEAPPYVRDHYLAQDARRSEQGAAS